MQKTKSVAAGFALILMVFAQFLAFIPQPALAAPQEDTAEFIDKVTIKYNGKLYFDSNPYDGDHRYKVGIKNKNNKYTNPTCVDFIDFDLDDDNGFYNDNPEAFDGINASWNNSIGAWAAINASDDSSDQCKVNTTNLKPRKLKMTHTDRKEWTAYRIDDDTIFVPVGAYQFACDVNPSPYDGVDDNADKYRHRDKTIDGRPNAGYRPNFYDEIQSNNKLDGDLWVETAGGKKGKLHAQGCAIAEDYELTFANDGKKAEIPTDVYGANINKPGSPANGNPADNPDDVGDTGCDANSVLTWIVCGIIDLAGNTMDWIQRSIIEPFLTISPLTTDNPTFDIWRGVRTFANILLVPIFLVIIYSAAINNRS